MEIKVYEKEHQEQIKNLLVELQSYIVEIDKLQLNILTPQYREQYFKKVIDEIYENKGQMFVAIEENIVIGFIAGHIRQYDEIDRCEYKCPQMGIVDELIISQKHRKLGVGNKLLSKIESFFKENNCEFSMLDVFAYNDNAKNFYTKNGYEERMITLIKKF